MLRSFRAFRSLVALPLGAILVAACADGTAPDRLVPPTAPTRALSDAAHGGVAGFYLLPPLVASAGTFTGTFDPNVPATARVCTPVPSCTTTVASFAVGAAGSAAITVDATRQWYAATWTAPASLTLGGAYRLEIAAGGQTLGYTDLYVVTSPTALRTVPAGYAGVVRGSALAIRFRLEQGVYAPATPPIAQDDRYTITGGSLGIAAASGLLANDALGTPAGAVVAFGGGSLGGTVTDAVAGATRTFGNGGQLTVNADGSVTFVAPNGFSGDFTFRYRVANASGTSDATVTIAVQRGPTAIADTYTAAAGGGLTLGAPGLLANDDRGAPLGVIVSFGGGSLAGDAATFGAGTTTAVAGGTLTVDADGSVVFLPAPGYQGVVTFQYRLLNAAGFSDATVTITVPAAPQAVNDDYVTNPIGGLVVSGSGLLTNDALGTPTATLTSFGGGSFGGSVNDHAAGTSMTFGSGGVLTVNADGSFSYQAPANFFGTLSFQYRLTSTAGTSVGTVSITVPRKPTAIPDRYTTPAGVGLTLPAGALLANDDRGTPQGTIANFGPATNSVDAWVAGTVVSFASGTFSIARDGGLTYTPAPGYVGTFSYAYRLTNPAGSSVATVTIVVGP